MTDFSDCPVCKGEGKPCTARGGCGKRTIDSDTIDMALSAREWLNDRVCEVFRDYCDAFGIFHAYSVDSWEFTFGTLDIVLDTSCRGCSGTTRHSLPSRYFHAEREERKSMMNDDAAAAERAHKGQDRIDKADRLRRLEEEAAELRNQLSA